jgi:hypothetical protein
MRPVYYASKPDRPSFAATIAGRPWHGAETMLPNLSVRALLFHIVLDTARLSSAMSPEEMTETISRVREIQKVPGTVYRLF